MSYKEFLFRGTTEGWPGNPALQVARRTSTSTDPLVATLFALEAMRKGESVVVVVNRNDLRQFERVQNHFGTVECEVALEMLPSRFRDLAITAIPVAIARDNLADMGFELPHLISDIARLRAELNDTFTKEQRLSVGQTHEFLARCGVSYE